MVVSLLLFFLCLINGFWDFDLACLLRFDVACICLGFCLILGSVGSMKERGAVSEEIIKNVKE